MTDHEDHSEQTKPSTGPQKPKIHIFGEQLSNEVSSLNYLFTQILQEGWQAQWAVQLKEHVQRLQKLIKGDDLSTMDVLINKLSETIAPLTHAQNPQPTVEELQLLQGYIKKLQDVIAVNVVRPPESNMDESTSPLHTLVVGLQDTQLIDELTQQLKYFGYNCIYCDSLDNVIRVALDPRNNEKLGAIILDTEYCPNRDPIPLKAISSKIPLIFISTFDDVATRLFAVKAGASAYFVSPIEFTSLIEKIDDALTPLSENPPLRILIVEDSRPQASIVSKHLRQAGMITEILLDPLKVNSALTEFQPDLILLDLYMPLCSGVELAKVIRQQDPFVSIPIVYLSAEDDPNKQLNAMRGGGDDFLTKPITPQYLVDAVTTRANRSRTLRAEMIQDSLTGLLNHTRILEQLELEIARARRTSTPLSFAMIDIDYFKAINDAHGHPVGDRVIKGLARLLKQRLRKMDSIGRYGGEEFALILPQTDGHIILKKLDEIRRSFAKLLHRSSDPMIEFSATFSIGLAQLTPEIDAVDKLIQAADKALYQAKDMGRNCMLFYNTQE